MFGGYQGWTAPSLVKLLSDEYPIPISQEDASIVATIGCLGHVIGGFLGSSLSDLIGRKTTIMSIDHFTDFSIFFRFIQIYVVRCKNSWWNRRRS